MNRTPIRRLLASLALGTSLVSGAFAAEPASPPTPTDSAPAAKNNTDTDSRQPNCVRDTGTRIKSKNRDCLGVAGRSYSAEELRQTGEANPLDALRRIDPSITGSVR